MGEFHEHAGHVVRVHEGAYVVPAAHRCAAAGGRGPGDGYPGVVQGAVAAPLVEEDGQLGGVVQAYATGEAPYGRGEPPEPAGAALHAGGIVKAAQGPVHLGVLPRRVEAYELVGGERGTALAQDGGPGHDAGRGQPGVADGLREQGDAAVLRIADDCPA